MAVQVENIIVSSGITLLYSTVTQITICASEPTTFAQATSNAAGYMIGSWAPGASSVFGAPAGGANGMSVTSNSCTTGTIFQTATASWWAACSGTSLYAHGTFTAAQACTSGNQFTLGQFAITIPNK